MWKTGARIISRHAAQRRIPQCARSHLLLPMTGGRQPRRLDTQMRAFWSTRGMQADSTIDKEKQRQQAQDDVREEMEEHRRERDEVADEDAGNEADLAPEVERLDPQSVPGLYPEFDAEEQPEEGDDSWYIDTSYAQSEAATVPLWQRRAAENLGQQTVDPDMLLKGSVLDLCCTMLREDGEVAVLDVSDRCDWTSKMVVARATSTRHMRAMGERMLKTIKERYRLTDSSRPIRVDGRESDDWVVVDMGSFIVHIMTPEAHQTYDLESLWTAPLAEFEESMGIYDEQIQDLDSDEQIRDPDADEQDLDEDGHNRDADEQGLDTDNHSKHQEK